MSGRHSPNAIPVPLRAKRRLGQNFLHDQHILEQIADAANLSPEDTVLEIGPGTGTLTQHLVERAGKVVAVEIDERMRPMLNILETTRSNFRVVWGDFMKLSWADLGLSGSIKVVANIPYYITTPILLKLLQAKDLERRPLRDVPPLADLIVMMVQEEVADRMVAGPGSKAYGSLSLIVQYATEIERVVRVPKTAFKPVPKVDSTVVRLIPRRIPPVEVMDARIYSRVIRGGFGLRRKTLLNSLMAAAFPREALVNAFEVSGIDGSRRGETLTMKEFATLADALGGPKA